LEAANRSPKTIRSYIDTVKDSLGQFLIERGYPGDVNDIGIEHLVADQADQADQAYQADQADQADQLRRFSASTAALRHRTLKVFFNWLVKEDEIPKSPMANLVVPKVGEIEVPVVPIEDVRRLLSACAKDTFDDRRDNAMIRLFYDTGVRLAEVAG
jgi:site-specific recombinase XerD